MTDLDERLRARLHAAAADLGGSEEARRRVVTAAPRRTLRPLSAALAVAVVFAGVGFLLTRAAHPSSQRGAARPSPTARATVQPTATPTPTPTPMALSFAPLFAHDDLSVGSTEAYGHLTLVGTDNSLAIGRYTLGAVHDPGSPPTAPVWRVDRSAPADVASLGARFGFTGTPAADPGGGLAWGTLAYSPEFAMLTYSGGTGSDTASLPHLDRVPTDTTLVALATDFLSRRGLLMDGLAQPRVVASGPQGARPDLEAWTLHWDRSVDGRPLTGTGQGISMSVGSQGAVSNLEVSALRIAGGSDYPLTSWHQAWAQVAAGRWYAERGGFTGGNAPSQADTFTATSVALGYLSWDGPLAQMSATERAYLVPMWVFTDSSGLRLFYPAVAPSALSYSWQPKPWPTAQS